MPATFSVVAGDGAVERGGPPGERRAGDARLLEQRRPQAVDRRRGARRTRRRPGRPARSCAARRRRAIAARRPRARRRARARRPGRMPAATTTRSAGELRRRRRARTPSTRPLPGDRLGRGADAHVDAAGRAARARAARAAERSSCCSISRSARCTTVTCTPALAQPARGLEPEQAAADHDRAARARRPPPRIARASARVRNDVDARQVERRGPAAANGREPVASTRAS